MNEQNYGSFEACKRLYDAGIVVETEAVWCKYGNNWSIGYRGLVEDDPRKRPFIPAPSMAEAWRMLPDKIDGGYELALFKIMNGNQAGYIRENTIFRPLFFSVIPTDALIDLLIWTRKEMDRNNRKGMI
jgi:hypothetical protein